MTLRLVKAEEKYKEAITDYLKEWEESGEKITPYAVSKGDVHDFPAYCEAIELKEPQNGLVPDIQIIEHLITVEYIVSHIRHIHLAELIKRTFVAGCELCL